MFNRIVKTFCLFFFLSASLITANQKYDEKQQQLCMEWMSEVHEKILPFFCERNHSIDTIGCFLLAPQDNLNTYVNTCKNALILECLEEKQNENFLLNKQQCEVETTNELLRWLKKP